MKAFRAGWLGVGGLVALLVGLVGCGDKGADGISRLEPRGVPYIEGVPVPDGFSIVNRASTDYESSGQRNAIHVYEGWSEPAAVRNFYRERMPQMGWARVSDQSVEGFISLRFEKTREACTVEIKPAMFFRTRIHVTVSPFSRATTTSEPPRRPVP